ncbi:MAG: hypothetical protein N2Z73_03700 [Endomicrobia bacterium]|nr:hypothetical protein [Endomicrobiia bacterium]
MKKFFVIFIFLCIVYNICFCPEYVYDKNTRQIILNKSEMTFVDIRSEIWKFESDKYLIYVSSDDVAIHLSTITISNDILLSGTTKYFFNNNFVIYSTSTYQVKISTR